MKHVMTFLKDQADKRPFFLFSFFLAAVIFLPFVYIRIVQLFIVDCNSSWLYGIISIFSIPVGIVSFVISALFLETVIGYIATILIFAGSVLISLIKESHNKRTIGVLLLLVACMLAFVSMPYSPALVVAKDYNMVLVTAPSPISRGLKSVQAVGEYHPCTYELLGWDAETLYYRSTCKHSQQIWQFNLHQERRPISIEHIPQNLEVNTLPRESVFPYLQAGCVFPPSVESSVWELEIKEPVLISPKGNWIALISQNPYSLEDVLLIQIKK